MEQARNENTRKVTREIVDQRCKSNVDILKEIAIIKYKIYQIKNYKLIYIYIVFLFFLFLLLL